MVEVVFQSESCAAGRGGDQVSGCFGERDAQLLAESDELGELVVCKVGGCDGDRVVDVGDQGVGAALAVRRAPAG